MPYAIEKRNGKYCVIKTTTNESLKCYTSKKKAKDYLAALEINVTDAQIHTLVQHILSIRGK